MGVRWSLPLAGRTLLFILLVLGGCKPPTPSTEPVPSATPSPTPTPFVILKGRELLISRKIPYSPDEFVRLAATPEPALLTAFLSTGLPVNYRAPSGSTALHEALAQEQWANVDLLLDAGADVNLPDEKLCPPLATLAAAGNWSRVAQFLQAGAKVDAPNLDKATPLMLAAASGSAEGVTLLLKAGANTAPLDREGRTALLLALQKGHPSIALDLMAHRVSPAEIQTHAAALLPLVVQTGDRALLLQLLQAKPTGLYWQDSVSARYLQALFESDTKLLQLLRQAHVTPPRVPGSTQPLLAFAVAWHAPKQVQLLLENGNPPDQFLIPADDPAFLALLPSKRLRNLVTNDEKVTPLILAAALGDGEIMQILLDAGANRYAITGKGVCATHFLGTQFELLKKLLPEDATHIPTYRVEINLSEQWAYYYEHNRMLMKSIVSTGKPGFETPTGRFLVTDKARSKVSTIYDVEMPFFMRLNGTAVGMHAGPTNGRPISHGCIRMPDGAAEMLFERAPIGTLVVIAP